MKFLCVHDVCEDLFRLNLNEYILTFDDALYSQFYYWECINKLGNDTILFIPTNAIIISDYVRKRFNSEFIKFKDCYEALDEWKCNNKRNHYMTLGEIKFLIKYYNIRIGGHSHNHMHPRMYGNTLYDRIKFIKNDVKTMFEWFKKHLNIRPVDFCFPFNEEDYFLKIILEEEGITNFYGQERTEIETLW